MRQGLAPGPLGVLMIIDFVGDENIISDVSNRRCCLVGELAVIGFLATDLRRDAGVLSLKESAKGSGLES